jgi:adenylate cyclase
MASQLRRKLATILCADVVEYGRLMGADEDGTMRSLTARRAIIDGLVAEHHGRVVNTAGDAVLANFPSVADGLACAIAMQRALNKRNDDLSADRQMWFRVGVHVGDVMIHNGDLFGDVVNIAARLEALAEPGGICVSAAVRDHVGGRADATFIDAGAQRVKNITEPVHVFRVLPNDSPKPSPSLASPLSLPDKPSVAVLPFTNIGGDAEQDFFADGIAADIITALSHYPSLFVIARNSCFTYKGHAVDIKQVGRELGVRYVLEGSLRKSGNCIRATAQLIEAETGNHVWGERYDRDLADIFAVQDEIADAVTVAIAPAIADAELRRAMRKPPGSLDAWGAFQHGLWHLGKFTADDTSLALEFFQKAIALDPNFAGGFFGLATAQLQAANTFLTRSVPEMVSSTAALARQAVSLDGSNAEARACLSRVLLTLGDYDGAHAEVENALALSPNLASAHSTQGGILIFSGHPRDGLAALERGIRLDPRDSGSAVRVNQMVAAHYLCRDYEAAIEAAKRVIRAYPEHPLVYRWFAAALGQAGHREEAGEALQKARMISPASFDLYVKRRVPWHRPEDHAHMLEGLRMAGWKA